MKDTRTRYPNRTNWNCNLARCTFRQTHNLNIWIPIDAVLLLLALVTNDTTQTKRKLKICPDVLKKVTFRQLDVVRERKKSFIESSQYKYRKKIAPADIQ